MKWSYSTVWGGGRKERRKEEKREARRRSKLGGSEPGSRGVKEQEKIRVKGEKEKKRRLRQEVMSLNERKRKKGG